MLQAELKIGYLKAVGLGLTALTTLGGFVVIALNGDLYALAAVNILATVPAVLMYQRLARLITRPIFGWDRGLFVSLLKEALPLALSGVFGVIYYRIDTVLLSLLQPSAAVGYYAATYKLTEVLNILPGAVMMAVFPLLARYAGDPAGGAALRRLFHAALKYLLALILPIALGVLLLADPIILFLYAPEYQPAATAMRLIIWAEIPMFISPVLYQILIAHRRQRLMTGAAAVMAGFNIAANLALIPLWGFNGAALATSLTELIGLALGFILVYRALRLGPTRTLAPIFAALVPYTLALLPAFVTGNLLLALPAGLVYLGALYVTGGWRIAELRTLLAR